MLIHIRIAAARSAAVSLVTASVRGSPCLGRTGVRSISIRLPWDKKRLAAEEQEQEQIRRFQNFVGNLDGPLRLPSDSPFRAWLDTHSSALSIPPSSASTLKKEEMQNWLSTAEAELRGVAKVKWPAISRMDWWIEGHSDIAEAQVVLQHILLAELCAELKKSKAVFNPQVKGEHIKLGVSEKVLNMVMAYMEGDVPTRLKAAWELHDEGSEGLLSQQGMEDAVYSTLQPVIGAVETTYKGLPIVSKKQAKAFAKFIKFYMRDSEDYPTKLRCVFHWSTQPPGKAKTISLDSYLATQAENFPEMHKVGNGCMDMYARVRRMHFAQKADDRETFRTGVLFIIGLGFLDGWIIGL